MKAEQNASTYWNNVLNVFGQRAPLPPNVQFIAQYVEKRQRNGMLQRLWDINSNEEGYRQSVFAKLFEAVCAGTDLMVPPEYVTTITMLLILTN